MERMTVEQWKKYLASSPTKRKGRSRSSGGTRKDIGFFVRSKWEANYVRILRFLNMPFEYEQQEFRFPVRRGTMTYLPDFYLSATDQFVEVKGHLDQRSKVQLSRFMQYYPDKAKRMLIVIRKQLDRKARLTKEAAVLLKIGYELDQLLEYEAWCREFSAILPNWES